MENFVSILVPVLLILVFIRVMLVPMKLAVKILVNSLGGFLCLWLLNSIAGFTGIYFPVNLVTTVVAGALGLPGIAILALAQLIL